MIITIVCLMVTTQQCFSLHSRVYKVLVSLKDHKMRHSNEQQAKQQKVEELRLVRLIAMGETEAIYKRNKTSSKTMMKE